MRLCNFLLAVGLSVIVGSGTLASSNQVPTLITSLDAGHHKLSSTNYFGRRSLRAAESVDKEERIFEAIAKWGRTTVWLNDGRSEAYVRQALKLEKLTGDALKSAQNYKYLEHFLDALEEKTLKAKVAKFVPTRDVWKENHLDDIPIAQLKESAGYKTYARYVNMFDDEMIRLRNNGVERPGLPKVGDPDLSPGMIRLGNKNKEDPNFSPTEMDARVDIWVAAERPESYVAKALDLDVRSYKRSPNYPYYKKYLNGKTERNIEKWLSSKVAPNKLWLTYELSGKKANELMKSSAFITYVRYSEKYDDEMFKLYSSTKEVKVDIGASPTELEGKVRMWAAKERPDDYVQKMLGMDKTALMESPNYQFYKFFLKLVKNNSQEKKLDT